ncbi:MAG TPA: trypsin-like peptidase domain-containing protein, partial [Candidatus Eisenbacteria bacterium]|nr:trypsin-like peptidase domain-containing protein [Candidatus Eisenbacteria bacterium]
AISELPDFVILAQRIAPSVVNISTTLNPALPRSSLRQGFPSLDEKGAEAFQHRGLGAGFVIDHDGHIVTNNHVVEDAVAITVKLSDGTEFQAKVIGRDPRIDLALIKVTKNEKMVPLVLGESDKLQVGEWVIAIGNPFGLRNSVSVGIVSAKRRQLGLGVFDDFIQTDAPVNPGSSGGPLIDLSGRVVGVTTAIASDTGANTGIGFAIPIDLVKRMVPTLKEKRASRTGWLGA